jgi:lauroyl/myristoyl acyltransferase
MRFQDALSGQLPIRIGHWIGQHMPRSVGYGLSRAIARFVVHFKPVVYWTVRRNLRQVMGHDVDDEMIHQVFYHAGQTYYDFFRAVGQPSSEIVRSVGISSATLDLMRSEMAAGRGVLLLGVHMSNFDLALLMLGAQGLPAQILSLASPQPGYDLLDDMRKVESLEATMISPQSLRAAVRRLKGGGLVMTGADRPVPGDQALTEFFGRLACLPVGPARMALMTGATVLLGACVYDPEEGYVLDISGPIEMVRTGNREEDVLASTRRLAVVMEEYVRAHPAQWMMFHPVWPDLPDGEEGD